ncbi:MAG: MCE family protein [Planctomycetales bacterium]|nr:MCE family protein [Planctomycetales bacterium]
MSSSPWQFLLGAKGMWLVTGICAVAAIVLVARARRAVGPEIVITFEQGHGLAPGDPLRLRGIDVGEVTSVTMSESLDGVEVGASLTPEAAALASEGTLFWIERPQVKLGAVRGLDTLVGPKYIGVQPGAGGGAARAVRFAGVESPRQFSDGETVGITIRFHQGHGVEVGAPVRFRGLQIGEVVSVELSGSLGHVLVHAELNRNAEQIARSGAQFWIERAQVSMARVRGLDTLIGGAYLAALPGESDGESLHEFDGLDAAPAEMDKAGGIEVVLESPARYGLKTGSPVLHRGVEIGNIVRVGLASDGAAVESRAFIQPAYRDLIRSNTQFWSNSGVGLEFGLLSGVQLAAESLETITSGGVAMATPDQPGKPVATGHRFALAKEADEKWLQWRPQIGIGGALLDDGAQPPAGLRATLRWQQRRFGFQKSRQAQCWAQAIDDLVICPWEGELPKGPLTVESDGKSFEIQSDAIAQIAPGLISLRGVATAAEQRWPAARLRRPTAPEDAVLFGGPDSLPVSAGRFRTDAERGDWRIDLAVELSEDWSGAALVAQGDGALLGCLVWNDGQPEIALMPKR